MIIILTIYIIYEGILFFSEDSYQPGASLKVMSKKLQNSKLIYIDQEQVSPDCKQTYCSWNYYSLKLIFPSSIQKEPNYSITSEDFPLICKPEPLGYSDKEALTIFPPINFPTCENLTQIYDNIISIDQDTQKLHMKCNGWYYLGNPANEELLGNYKYGEVANEYNGPVQLKNNEEWAFGACDDSNVIEGATYRHLKNDDSIKRVRQAMKEQQKIAFDSYRSNDTMPLTVIMVVLDSISRESFYRSLPHSRDLLSSLNQSEFIVYDFKTHNVQGDSSIYNQFPTWTGKQFIPQNDSQMEYNSKQVSDLLEDSAIWSHFRNKGWITLFGNEFCNDYFSKIIGKKPKVDHIITKFWCAAKELSGFDDISKTQRCIGNKNSHYYLLNYTLDFVENYSGLNKFAYFTILPAHESSGTVIQTLDDDLVYYLKRLMASKDKVVIFLVADHGMRYGEWYKSEKGKQEHMLPMLMMIVSTEIIEEIPFSSDVLFHNVDRLVSKFDLYATLKYLADIPYHRGADFGYDKVENDYAAVSLFQKKIPNDRKCNDVGISPEFCSCNEYTKLGVDDNKNFLTLITEEIILQINELSQLNNHIYGLHFCKKITLKNILSAEWIMSNESLQYIRVLFSIKEKKFAAFKVLVSIFSRKMKILPKKESFEFNPIFESGKQFIRILDINLTNDGSLCNTIKDLNKNIPSYCICNSLEYLNYYDQWTLEKIQDNFKYFITNAGMNCIRACKQQKLTCSELGTNVINTCKGLMKVTGCEKCSYELLDYPPSIKNEVCYLSEQNFNCDYIGKEKRICACEK